MKGKKLIVIMAIVILIFTVQASCALDKDNDFNLTQTNDIDTLNVQIDNVNSNILDDGDLIVNESKTLSTKASVSSEKGVLKASNDNDVLGVDRYATQPTISHLSSLFASARAGDNIFLNGMTFTGSFTSISVSKALNIYGGSYIGDPQTATIDFSQCNPSKSARIKFSGITNIYGVNFVNHYYSSTTGDDSGRGNLISSSNALSLYDCSFINNSVFQKSCIIEYNNGGTGLSTINNCNFYNNSASLIISTKANGMKFTANNNRFVNNTGTRNLVNNTNSLGLCIKVQAQGATLDNNTFINNTNAVHGAAYCVNAYDVQITNNYIAYNQASYGAGIECHLGSVYVYNTTFIGNKASGGNAWHKDRNGTGGAIAFIGPYNTIDECTFINNYAENYGGAMDIHTRGSEVADDTNVFNSRFENNIAQNQFAGAVYIQGENALIDNCNFTNNSAPTGGAIQIIGVNAQIYTSNFVDNNAIVGGACYVEGDYAQVYDSRFENNNATHDLGDIVKDDSSKITAGGAMYVKSNDVTIMGTTFTNNTAVGKYADNTGFGGALYLVGQNPVFEWDEFTGNDAVLGGGVYVSGNNIAATDITLMNNTAVKGGAVFIEGNDIILTRFDASENLAIQGGAIYIEGQNTEIVESSFEGNNATREIDLTKPGAESLLTMGGAVYIEGSDVDLYGDNTFTKNHAIGKYTDGGQGGAIYVNGNNTNVYESHFTLNDAVKGGAIYVNGENATVKDMYFTTNNAIQGGSIYIQGLNANITNNTFYDNNATHDLSFPMSSELNDLTTRGGAITINGNDASIINNNFTYNAAIGINIDGGHGGAIAIDGYYANVTENIFDDNEAVMGGALYVTGTNTTVVNANFTNNRAIKGGAAYIKGLNTTIYDANFIGNNATHKLTYSLDPILDSINAEGGAIDIVGNNTYLYDIEFSKNNAIGVNPDGGHGGAVAVNGYDTTIKDVNFTDNQAIMGGAMYVNGTLNSLNYTNFTQNKAIRGGGAFISASNTTVLGSVFDSNEATHELRFDVNDELNKFTAIGGGITIHGEDVEIYNSTFINNTAVGIYENGGLGGAVAVNGSDNYIYNSEFIDNEAIIGGAFYLEGGSTVIDKSNFTDNQAIKGGAGFINGKNSLINDSLFENNNATHDLRFNLSDVLKDTVTIGGAIYITGNDVNVTSSNFTNNHANGENENLTLGGGAFFIEGNNANISNSKFEENTALKGGAVYVTGNVTKIYDSNFTRNSVSNFTNMEGFGGAVYLENSHESDFTRCNFVNNTASINGGAIDWHEGATGGKISECTFENNTAGANAGAVFWFGTGGIIENSNFTNNKANGTEVSVRGDSGNGGAILWTGSNGTVDNCNFINNTAATKGGSVFVRSIEGVSVCDNNTFKNSHFENNTAGVNGGAIDWNEGATNGAIINSTFENNSAKANGGAVYWYGNNGTIESSNFTNNRALGTATGTYGDSGDGGAVIWTGSNGVVDDCIFVNNSAKLNGGAVYLHNLTADGCNNTVFSNSRFENNTAGVNGGAIDWHAGATNGAIINSTFNNNTAKANGGAVYWFGENGTINDSNFTNNRALGTAIGTYGNSGDGGAVIWTGSNGIVDGCEFINNTAAYRGGAVYLQNSTNGHCDNTTFANSRFENNVAGTNGGAIDWHAGATNGAIINSTFDNNTAHRSAGAVYWNGEQGTIVGSNFTNNRVTGVNKTSEGKGGEGGAVVWIGSDGLVDDCVFVNNTAPKNGGAVYLESSDLGQCDNTTFANSHFENNTAGNNGGAIDWHAGATNGKISNSTFENNNANRSAGAVYWYGTNGTIENSNFTNNHALGDVSFTDMSQGSGGAVLWTGSNGLVDNCIFDNNTANNHGGAVYLESSSEGDCNNTTFVGSHFNNNHAGINGGAIDWHEGATNGAIINSTFDNNVAEANAGAVFWFGDSGDIIGSNFTNNRANGTANCVMGNSGDGGAIMWTGSNGLVDGSNFINNSATNNGGAVYLRGVDGRAECDNNTFANSHFENNTAGNNGGAINYYYLATNGKISNSTFENNNASFSGGAVNWYGTNGTIENSNFTNNHALGPVDLDDPTSGSGGAIRWAGSNGLVDNSIFENNTANNHGGAVYLEASANGDANNTTFVNSHFENNIAGVNGGAIDWHEGATNGRIENTTFENNTAESNGGAVFWYGTNGTIVGSNFTNNRANGTVTCIMGNSGDGGAIMWTGSNGLVENSEFVNNSAANDGGAVYLRAVEGSPCDNTTFVDSKFINNTAVNQGGAIDWNENVTNGTIKSSLFVNNTAYDGGAVSWTGHDGEIVDSNFTSNSAENNGGAVRWSGIDGDINNCRFVDNNATYGGAVFLQNCTHRENTDVTIADSYFENNTAVEDGGAIDLHMGTNATVENGIFVNNTANRGGAIFANMSDATVKESNFTGNQAILGGAVYLNEEDITVTDSDFTDNAAIQGGAVYVDGDNNKIINSNFNNNNATYDLRVNTSDDLKTKGGAIYINKANTVIENSKFYNNSANTIRPYNGNGNDPSASDDGFGGAIYVGANDANIKSSEFNDNKACNGSALYNDASGTLLDDDTFIKNQAWSYILNATAVPNSTYYGTTVTVGVLNYTGGDNILNGIYNNADVNDIVFNEVTYIVNNAESETRKTGNRVSPVSGATQSTELYQDSRERYQEITIEVISNATGKVVLTKNIQTDLYGNYSFNVTGLLPGNYTVKAYHNEDRNYKYILSTSDLEIIPFVDLNITKDVSSYYTIKGNNVTFTVTVSNANNASNATNLTIKDVLPIGLEYLKVTVTKGNYDKAKNVWSIAQLDNGTSAILTMVFNTTQIGKFNNTVNVTCNEEEWNYTNNNATVWFEVIPFNLTINKTANVTFVGNNTLVNYTIFVHNNAVLNATNVVITDILPEGFVYVSSNYTVTKNNANRNITWIVNNLGNNSNITINVIARSVATGNWTNNATVNCSENRTIVKANATVEVVPVNITVNKTVDLTVVGNNTVVTFTIIVNNTSIVNATNVEIIDYLPSGLTYISNDKNVTDIDVAVKNNVITWNIDNLANGTAIKLTITAISNAIGNWTNVVNITSHENNTIVSDNATVEVVPVILNVTKAVNVTVVGNNTLVNFTITVNNTSLVNATDIVINDILPSGLTYVDSNGTYTKSNGIESVSWNIGNLANKTQVKLWITARSNAIGNWTNVVNVTCSENKTIVKANATVEVVPVNVTINKTANVTVVGNNTLVNFTIVVNNTARVNATTVVIKDLVPAGFEIVKVSSGNVTTGKLVSWTIDSIANKTAITLWIVVRSTAVGNWTNVVNVTNSENKTVVKDNASVEVVPVNLTINKTAEVKGNISVGEEVTFTINITNNAKVNATKLNITDVVPSGFEFVKSNATGYNSKTGLLNIDVIEAGKSYVFTITLKAITNGTLTNVVNVTANENNTVKTSNASVNVTPVVNLTVKKIVDFEDAIKGDVLTFTIIVTNNGPSNATNINITDVLPKELELVDGYKLNHTIAFLASGKSANVTIKVKTTKIGNYTNCVNVTCDQNKTIKSANVTVEVLETDLRIIKTANVTQPIYIGDYVNFTITIRNHGEAEATNVNITDLVPKEFEIISSNGTNKTNGQTIIWNVGNLTSEQNYTIWLVVRAKTNGTFTNTAYVNCTEEPHAHHDSETIIVRPIVKFEVNKTVNITEGDVIGAGNYVEFTINVTNKGISNATGVNITDVVPEGFEFISTNATGYNNKTGKLTISLIKPNESYVFTIKMKIVKEGNLTNIVNVTSNENNTIVSSNVTVHAVPVILTVNKTADVTVVGNNTLVEFTIIVNNTSIVNATDVEISDYLPAGLVLVETGSNMTGLTVKNSTLTDGRTLISWNIAEMVNGSAIKLVVVARTNATGNFTNVVNVTSFENETDVMDNVTVKVVPVILTVNKTANVTVVGNNTLVNFTIIVNNTSLVNATGVVINDYLPVGLVYVDSGSNVTDLEATTEDLGNGKTLITWNIAEIVNGSSIKLWITARTNATGNLTNVVNATSKENKTNVTGKAKVEIVPVVLNVTKTANVTVVGNNTEVIFTIVVNNTARVNATNVTIKDVVPNGFVIVSAAEGDVNGQEISWNITNLEAGAVKVYTIVARTNATGNWTNVVNVTSNENNTNVSSDVTVEVVPVVLNVTKTADLTVVGNNTVVTFTIVVNNDARVNATNVTIKDVVPNGFTIESTDGTVDGQNVTWTIGNLESGKNQTFVIVARSNATGIWTNEVNVTCDENSTVFKDTEIVEVVEVNATVIKTADLTVVGNNTLVNFTIVVNNTARVNATHVWLTDLLPNGFVFVNATEGYEQEGQEVIWYVGTLTSGETRTYWVQARSIKTGNWTNSVNITCDENSTVLGNTTDVEVVPVILTVNKTANVTVVGNNTEVIFTIVVNNTARVNATNITIKDIVPAGFTIVSTNGTTDNNNVTWFVDALESGKNVTFVIVARTNAIGNWTNEVNVTCDENVTIFNDTEIVKVLPVNLTVVKSADIHVVGNNTLVTFTIVVNNTGDINATGVNIKDALPKGFEFVKVTEGNVTTGNVVSWTFDLNSGDNKTFTIVARSLSVGNWTNIVNVTSNENKTIVNSSDRVEVVDVNLTVNKTANVTVVGNNTLVNFTIVVNNTAVVNATGVVIIDYLPAGLTYVSFTSDVKDLEPTIVKLADGRTSITWNVTEMVNGSSIKLMVTVRTNATGNLTNVVNVTSKENNTNVSSDVTVEVVPVVLNVTKSANVAVVGNNTEVIFTIVVNNTARVNATNVTIKDVVPNGFVIVSAAEGVVNGQEISWNITNLEAGAVKVYTIVARTNATGNWTNVVNVSSEENNTNVSSDVTVEVVPVILVVNKTADLTVVGNNTVVTFTIVVKNAARINATNITVSDILPTGFTIESTSGRVNGQNISWTIDALESGKNVTYTIVARTNATGNWTNVVNVTSKENNTNVSSDVTVEVVPVNMTVIKTADLTVVGNNTLVNFTIVVNNPARVNATNVTLTDLLPEGFAFVNATEGYKQDGQKVAWYIGILTSGETRTYWVQAKSSATGNWTNSVNITCDENSTVISNTTDVEVVPIILTVNKTANITVIANNTLVDFTIVVNNTSRVSAFNVTVGDVLPNGFAFVNATEGYKLNGNEISWNFENFANASGVELWIQVRSIAAGNWTNTVKVSSNENNTVVSGNETVEVVPMNLTVIKIANFDTIDVLGLINFTIEVTNNAPVAATDVTITDVIDLSVFELKGHNGTFTQDGGKLVWNIDSLASGETFKVWIEVKALTNGTFTNTVNVTTKENKTPAIDTAVVNVTPVVKFIVNKTANAVKAPYDGYVVFTISVTNNGPSNATNVVIRDVLPDGFTFFEAGGYPFEEEESSLFIDLIEPGHTIEFTITALAVQVGNWTNVVEVTSDENSTPVKSNVSVEIVNVNLTVTKTANVTVVGNNTLVNFTIVVKNNDVFDAHFIEIIDSLQDGLIFVDANGDYYYSDQLVMWYAEELGAGDSLTYWIVAKVSELGNLTNEVFVIFNEGFDTVTANDTVEVAPVNLTINKTADVDTIDVNKEITFTINVTNNAHANATNVTITDVVPAGFEFVESSASDYDKETGVLTIPIIKAGESYVFTITLKAIVNGTLTNIVNVTCGENDTVITSSVDVNVTPVVNLTVVKVADSDDATIGDVITFTITVTNNGPSNATNIKVTDILDDGFTLVSGELEQVIPFLASGNSTTIVVKVQTTANGTYTNNVNVTCDQNDTVWTSNASVHVYNTDLKINKTAEVSVVSVNDVVKFIIVVKNHGKSNATNVIVTDVLDDAFEFVGANGTFTRNGQTIVWTFDKLLGEETATVWVSVKALTGGTFENVAHVNCSEEGTVKNSTTTVQVNTPSISIADTADDEFVYSGNQTSFTIKVTNDGEVTLTGVNVEQVIPDGLIYDHFTGSNWTYDGNKFIYNGSLAVGESVDFIIVVNTTKSGKFVHNATASSDQTGRVSDDDSVLVYTPALTVREISNNPVAVVGQTVSFTVVVTNIGDCDLTGVYTVNNFPDGLIYTGYDGSAWDKVTSGLLGAPAGGWTQDGNRFDYQGILKPGESANYTLYFDTTRVGVFTPEVIANSDLTSNAYSNNTTVVVEPKLEVTQDIDKPTVNVGDKVVITVTVTNVGGCDLGDVYVIENIPEGLEYLDYSGNGWSKNGTTFIYNGTLGIGESASFEMVFKAVKEGNVTNNVVAGSNMTEEIDSDVDVEIVNKTKPTPTPEPTPVPTPVPTPEPTPEVPQKAKHVTQHSDKYATGNPIILLLLVILAIIPLRRKH